MTEAEKLLQETKSAAVVAESQAEDICVIDSDLRIIGIPEQFKVLGVEHDKDVKVIQFRIPKVYKGTDLSAFTISVNYQNARGTKDRYVVTDKKVSGDQIEFSWTVGKTAIEYRGDTRFIVCMRLTGSDGIIQKEFNTTLATMTVLEGLEVDDPAIEQEEKDIIAQLLQIVDDKSKEAVQAVTEEGTKQIKAVQAAAQEIAADREQIKTNKADIADLMQTKAGAIINSARGERIAVGDSAGAFFEGLKLYGRSEQVTTKGYQLFDASKIPTKSIGGATITNNGDGSFTISGSGNLTTNVYHYHTYNREESIQFLKAGNIYLKQNGDTNPKALLLLYRTTDSKTVLQLDNETTVGTITDEMLNYDDLAFRIYIHAQSGQLIKPGTVKPMLYQFGDGTWEPFTGGKPSPSMEYKQDSESSGDSGEIGINMHGYNLFDASKIQTKSAGGATVTNNGDGSFTISGSGNLTNGFDAAYSLKHEDFIKIFKPGTLIIKTEQKTTPFVYMNVVKNGEYKTTLFTTYDSATRSVNLPQEYFDDVSYTFLIGINGSLGNAIKTGTIKPMLYQDGNGAFEPFIPLRSTQFSTSNGLPGLPVESGGNYTDESGQQWVCDEMDFKRGKYVQRIEKLVLNGNEEWALQSINGYGIANFATVISKSRDSGNVFVLSSHFREQKTVIAETKDGDGIFLTTISLFLRFKKEQISTVTDLKAWLKENPVTVIYGLAYPMETDIPEETMTAYRNLYTNYPSTVIQNDSGAGMEVEYVADTKQFILDQIKALVQA
jgi:hypothetical protein